MTERALGLGSRLRVPCHLQKTHTHAFLVSTLWAGYSVGAGTALLIEVGKGLPLREGALLDSKDSEMSSVVSAEKDMGQSLGGRGAAVPRMVAPRKASLGGDI